MEADMDGHVAHVGGDEKCVEHSDYKAQRKEIARKKNTRWDYNIKTDLRGIGL
jgi:hypothetical protein